MSTEIEERAREKRPPRATTTISQATAAATALEAATKHLHKHCAVCAAYAFPLVFVLLLHFHFSNIIYSESHSWLCAIVWLCVSTFMRASVYVRRACMYVICKNLQISTKAPKNRRICADAENGACTQHWHYTNVFVRMWRTDSPCVYESERVSERAIVRLYDCM